MGPAPIVLGLTICEKAIVEEGTRNVTLVNTFTKINVEDFPAEIYSTHGVLQFPDHLAEVRVLFRINNCEFFEPGAYQVTLYLDGEPLARRVLRIAKRGN